MDRDKRMEIWHKFERNRVRRATLHVAVCGTGLRIYQTDVSRTPNPIRWAWRSWTGTCHWRSRHTGENKPATCETAKRGRGPVMVIYIFATADAHGADIIGMTLLAVCDRALCAGADHGGWADRGDDEQRSRRWRKK